MSMNLMFQNRVGPGFSSKKQRKESSSSKGSFVNSCISKINGLREAFFSKVDFSKYSFQAIGRYYSWERMDKRTILMTKKELYKAVKTLPKNKTQIDFQNIEKKLALFKHNLGWQKFFGGVCGQDHFIATMESLLKKTSIDSEDDINKLSTFLLDEISNHLKSDILKHSENIHNEVTNLLSYSEESLCALRDVSIKAIIKKCFFLKEILKELNELLGTKNFSDLEEQITDIERSTQLFKNTPEKEKDSLNEKNEKLPRADVNISVYGPGL